MWFLTEFFYSGPVWCSAMVFKNREVNGIKDIDSDISSLHKYYVEKHFNFLDDFFPVNVIKAQSGQDKHNFNEYPKIDSLTHDLYRRRKKKEQI